MTFPTPMELIDRGQELHLENIRLRAELNDGLRRESEMAAKIGTLQADLAASESRCAALKEALRLQERPPEGWEAWRREAEAQMARDREALRGAESRAAALQGENVEHVNRGMAEQRRAIAAESALEQQIELLHAACEDATELRKKLRDMVEHYERAMERYPIMDEPAAYTLDRARALLAPPAAKETP